MKGFLALGAMIVLVWAGCATTLQRKVEPSPAICGFLGADVCDQLEPGARGEAGLRYRNPKGTFTQYDKVTIVVVGFFGSDAGKVSPKDEVEVALLDAEAATAGARSITMVVPQLRVLSAGYAAVAGRYPFSGGGQAAAKISDSMTEQVLGAGVDRRAGGGSIKTAAQWQWGDAENAIKIWASLLADGMYAYTSGEKKP
jgi:hypothetical protein